MNRSERLDGSDAHDLCDSGSNADFGASHSEKWSTPALQRSAPRLN